MRGAALRTAQGTPRDQLGWTLSTASRTWSVLPFTRWPRNNTHSGQVPFWAL